MDEEKILHDAFEIKKRRSKVHSTEERKILDRANSIIIYRTGVVGSLESTVEELSNRVLRDVEDPKNWQPSEYLPDFSSEGWVGEIKTIQDQARGLSKKLRIVLIGDWVTEDGIITYGALLKDIEAIRGLTGNEKAPWGKWRRWWTAEENRHGDWLKGEFCMPVIEGDIQRLIQSGFDPGVGECPYKFLSYTTFQERATQISHMGTARIAREQGTERLYKTCKLIAADEARHYVFYQGILKAVFEADPNGAMTAHAYLMRKKQYKCRLRNYLVLRTLISLAIFLG